MGVLNRSAEAAPLGIVVVSTGPQRADLNGVTRQPSYRGGIFGTFFYAMQTNRGYRSWKLTFSSRDFWDQYCIRRITTTNPTRPLLWCAAPAPQASIFPQMLRQRTPRGGGHGCHPFMVWRGLRRQFTGRERYPQYFVRMALLQTRNLLINVAKHLSKST